MFSIYCRMLFIFLCKIMFKRIIWCKRTLSLTLFIKKMRLFWLLVSSSFLFCSCNIGGMLLLATCSYIFVSNWEFEHFLLNRFLTETSTCQHQKQHFHPSTIIYLFQESISTLLEIFQLYVNIHTFLCLPSKYPSKIAIS